MEEALLMSIWCSQGALNISPSAFTCDLATRFGNSFCEHPLHVRLTYDEAQGEPYHTPKHA